MNYFTPKSTAERYSKGRPYFHPNTINRIQDKLKLDKAKKLTSVLDVACGTGLSTQALKALGEEIIGTDSSSEMLNHARQIDGIQFIKAFAEEQPFENEYFDLITVSSGIHWFKIDEFLAECNRLLKEESYLVVYDNFFISEMIDVPNFKNWFPKEYLKQYPSPPRNNQYDWSAKKLETLGFELIEVEQFKNQVTFSKEELILYFTTQSNITNEVSNNNSTYEEVESWLNENLGHFFENETAMRTFNFGNWIRYLKKLNNLS